MHSSFIECSWKTDTSGRVIVPKFLGDGELTSVSMNLDSIELLIVNRGALISGRTVDASDFIVKCAQPEFINFKSNHLQNVIDAAYIVEKKFGFDDLKINGIKMQDISHDLNSLTSSFLLFLTPLTGVEVVVAANRIQFFERKRADE